MKMQHVIHFVCAVLLLIAPASFAQAVNYDVPLFNSADLPNRPFFRAPVLLSAPDGSLLAFGEAREKIDDPGRGDGLSDIIMKMSLDGGQTWSTIRTLYSSATNDYTQPTVVLDSSTRKIFLHFEETPNLFLSNGTFISKGNGSNTFHHYVMQSDDNGQTWSTAQVITTQLKDANWDVFALGPTTGIQLKWQTDPALNGRLIIPGFRSDGSMAANLVVYNDAHGATASWQRGMEVTSAQTNEVDLVELTNGNLLMNARSDQNGPRQQYLSTDGGQTWGIAQALDLPVTPIDASLIRYSAKRQGDDRDRLLFSTPLGDPMGQSSGANYNDRYNIGVWTSYDEGKTYINPRQIAAGWGGYSAMQKLPDGSIGIMYESSYSTDKADIRYANFDLLFLEGQQHQAQLTHYDGFGNTIDRMRGGMGWSGKWYGDPTVNPTGLSFADFRFPTEPGRFDLVNGASVERELATKIDLNQNATTYFSLLLSNTDPSVGPTNNNFVLELRDSSETSHAAIGVSSAWQFLVAQPGNSSQGTPPGTVQRNQTYFLVAKIVSTDDQTSGNYDQIFLKVFQSGVDLIPDNDDTMPWTVVGLTGENSNGLIDRIAMIGGLETIWSIDELRIGTTWGAVASNLAVVPEPASLATLLGVAGLSLLARRQHSTVRP
ncbi:MAG: exo-alpha-sialidase [Phycisphaerales bacterium]|nr:exo-alpha-sialidase [Phycisphaerales bacterium]